MFMPPVALSLFAIMATSAVTKERKRGGGIKRNKGLMEPRTEVPPQPVSQALRVIKLII